jgi:hypothetical protein
MIPAGGPSASSSTGRDRVNCCKSQPSKVHHLHIPTVDPNKEDVHALPLSPPRLVPYSVSGCLIATK